MLDFSPISAPFAEGHSLGILAIDVKRLGLSREIEHDTVKGGTQIRRGDDDALSKRQDAQSIARKDGQKEVQGISRLVGS